MQRLPNPDPGNNGEIRDDFARVLELIDAATGVSGTQGPQGEPGAGWLTGEWMPYNALGRNDDLYLDTETGDVYKKGNGIWL